MKTFKKILIFVTGVFLLGACSKDENGFMQGDEFQNDDHFAGKVFPVRPTNGTDITVVLQQAFDAAILAGPGSVVQLPKGGFELGFIEIRDFYGSFVGAGKGKTVINAKTGLDPNNINNEGSNLILIKFIGGDIHMEGMTLKTPPGTLTNDGGYIFGTLLFSDYGPQYTSKTGNIRALVNNVEFVGQELGDAWYDPNVALSAMPDYSYWYRYGNYSPAIVRSNIDVTVANCSFSTFNLGTYFLGIRKGKINLGKNVFNTYQSASFNENINIDIQVISNTLNLSTNYWGLDVDNYPWGWFTDEMQYKKVTCNIEGNKFNLGGLYGLWLHDHRIVSYPDEKRPMLMQVKNNTFNMLDAGTYGSYMIELQNAVIRNNKFTGSGSVGFLADAWNEEGYYSQNCLFVGNNFSKATFSDKAIILGPFTKNFTVIGQDSKDLVQDDGVNNVIKNMNGNGQHHPHGHDIYDNQHNVMDKMFNYNHHH
jgi:hypothetical protein